MKILQFSLISYSRSKYLARSADSGRWFRWLRRREEIRGADQNLLSIYWPIFLLTPKSTIRFDPLCGEFNDKLFKESYQFVNEVKSKELVELKKQLRTEEDHERREEVLDVNQELMIILFPLHQVKYLIQRMENQLRAEAQNQVKRAQAEAENSEKKEKLKSGEKPFYMSKAKRKEAELVSKYEELQSKGGLDSFMRKTTKKKDSKERKKGLGVTVK